MFGTEIEFFGILGTGCFSTARSFLSSVDWLVPTLSFSFSFSFFTRCSCKWNDWGCFQVACLRLLLQHEQAARVDGWMDGWIVVGETIVYFCCIVRYTDPNEG